MFLTPRVGIPDAPESLRQTPSPAFAAAIAAVEQGIASGELVTADAGELILYLWATAHGLIALHFTGRFGFDDGRFRRSYDRTVRFMLARVKPARA